IGRVPSQLPPTQVIGVPPKEDDDTELFGNDISALDDLPDDLEPIDDITDVVAPKPAARAAPAPAPAPSPIKPHTAAPKFVPPPPARTTRAVSAFDGLDADAL